VIGQTDREPQDAAIIRQVVEGDVNAFEVLLDRYGSLVFSVASKHVPRDLVEEVAQDAFLAIFRSLHTFSHKGPFSHWVATIAVRCCYDFWRHHGPRREIPFSSLSEDPDNWMDAVLAASSREAFEREAARRDAAEVLEYALAGLSAEDRMVLTLVHLEGRSVREAAQLLGWSQVSVRVRAHRSRQKLRKTIGELLEERRCEEA